MKNVDWLLKGDWHGTVAQPGVLEGPPSYDSWMASFVSLGHLVMIVLLEPQINATKA